MPQAGLPDISDRCRAVRRSPGGRGRTFAGQEHNLCCFVVSLARACSASACKACDPGAPVRVFLFGVPVCYLDMPCASAHTHSGALAASPAWPHPPHTRAPAPFPISLWHSHTTLAVVVSFPASHHLCSGSHLPGNQPGGCHVHGGCPRGRGADVCVWPKGRELMDPEPDSGPPFRQDGTY